MVLKLSLTLAGSAGPPQIGMEAALAAADWMRRKFSWETRLRDYSAERGGGMNFTMPALNFSHLILNRQWPPIILTY